MYNGMFDENHKLILQPFRQGEIEKREVKRPSEGEYEGGLMCDECDNKLLGHYFEDYASRAIYGGKLSSEECPAFQKCINQDGIGFIKCQKINYHKFKLFLLSVLWRASISTRPFFSEISLPSENEEEIREMILSRNAGEAWKYPIFICTYANYQELPKSLIAQPREIMATDELRLYLFMINGYFYFFYINKTAEVLPHFVIPETIKPNNELNISVIPANLAQTFILGQFGIKP